MVFAVVLASCSQREAYEERDDNKSDKLDAIESTYKVLQGVETYAGTDYVFPYVEGMINMSKQARINGNAKRFCTDTTKDNDGVRGAISNSYEVTVITDELISIIFPTSLNVDIPTRTLNMVIKAGPEGTFIYTIDNLFGRAEDAASFDAMRAEFEAAGADASIADEDFWQYQVYFEGEDMTDLILHVTYFTDKAYDISLPFADVFDYVLAEKADMFGFTE